MTLAIEFGAFPAHRQLLGSDRNRAAFFWFRTGEQPTGGVLVDSSGNIFGTAQVGPGPYGAIWELAHGSNSLTTLAAFDGANGANPYAGLTLGPDGQFYGTTLNGGAFGDGTVFEFSGESTSIVHEPSSAKTVVVIATLTITAVGFTTRRRTR
jgi:uncharacterized repeat protein (TIGR03803 family)